MLCGVLAVGSPRDVLSAHGPSLTSAFCKEPVAAVPLAELTPGSDAVEVLQSVQCVLEASTDKSHMLIIPAGDGC